MDRVLDQRYRILEPLGVGGSSQVYVAEDAVLKRKVAVKVLDPHAAADDTLRKLFVREARALAQLSHPNVVAVHDVGEVDGLPFIVMELVEGTSLKQAIERAGALSVADAVRLCVEIAGGLAFAHSRGIIHADLKPSNILLDKDEHAKICDFGIARTPQEDADSPQLFATAMYVAPERVEGKPASVATDIYGLGLILYEMLVGKPPFTSANAAVLLRDHVVRQPVPPSHLRPSLPKELDAVVLKALAKQPGFRYGRASDVATALGRIENVDKPLATTRFADGAHVMTQPIRDFVPATEESPVVSFLSTYGQPIRRAFFGVLTALPLFGLLVLAGFGAIPALVLAGFVAFVAFAGQLGIALALAWVIETMLVFLFVPGLALLFGLMGIWVWLRDVPAESSAMALAMPATAPFGFAPALILSSAAVKGLSGVVNVAWGATITVLYAIAAGKQSLGPFVQTGLTLENESLFSLARAEEVKSALLAAVQPGAGNDRFAALGEKLSPVFLIDQIAGLISRVSGADVTVLATIISWIVAALVVWTTTRLLRSFFDTLLRRPRRWFALYVFATSIGVTVGGAVLYMLSVTWSPLASALGRPADGILFVSALVGAIVALAVGVVISATERAEPEDEALPSMSGMRQSVR